MLDTLLACEFVDLGSLNIEDEAIPLLAIAGGITFLVITVVFHTVRNIALGGPARRHAARLRRTSPKGR